MTQFTAAAGKAIVNFFKHRMVSSSRHAAFTGAVPPAAPVETSLQTLVRLAQLTHMPDGERVQSIQLTCGIYAMARFLGRPAIGTKARCEGGKVFIGRCLASQSADYQPDQWKLVIYPMNGKAEIYEGMVE